MTELQIRPQDKVILSEGTGRPEQVHVFDEQSVLAVSAAQAARRPLLVRGEPGVGKTQLAAAVAKATARPLVSCVVDVRTESRDLLWQFDAVMRLAEAQLMGALRPDLEEARRALAVERFLRPGSIWWAFDWRSASQQAQKSNSPIPEAEDGADPDNGCVLLIDEIDKAESDVPNGLLEALGAAQFTPFGYNHPIVATGKPPLVFITTNEERVLPDAFVRRCLVLQISLPQREDDLISFLVERGRAHFDNRVSDKLLQRAAHLLVNDRTAAKAAAMTPLPGQAEFLDLVRAILDMTSEEQAQIDLLQSVAAFAVRKHSEAT